MGSEPICVMFLVGSQARLVALLVWAWVAVAAAQTADPSGFFLRTSTHVGVGNVLRVGLSADGVNFTDLFSTPTLTN